MIKLVTYFMIVIALIQSNSAFSQLRKSTVVFSGRATYLKKSEDFTTSQPAYFQNNISLSTYFYLSKYCAIGYSFENQYYKSENSIRFFSKNNTLKRRTYSVIFNYPLAKGLYILSEPFYGTLNDFNRNTNENTTEKSIGIKVGMTKFLTRYTALRIDPFLIKYTESSNYQESIFNDIVSKSSAFETQFINYIPAVSLQFIINSEKDDFLNEKLDFTDYKIIKGNVNYTSDTATSIKEKSIEIVPSVSIFATRNILLGIGLGYHYSYLKNDESFNYPGAMINSNKSKLSFYPFLRFYKWMNKSGGAFIEAESEIAVTSAITKKNYNNPIYNVSSKSFSPSLGGSINAGFTIMLTERVLLDCKTVLISYSSNKDAGLPGKNLVSDTKSYSKFRGIDLSNFKLSLGYLIGKSRKPEIENI